MQNKQYLSISFLLLILIIIGLYFKHPYINPDGLLYLSNADDFDGSLKNISTLYGLPLYSILIYYLKQIFGEYFFSVYFINIISILIIHNILSRLNNKVFENNLNFYCFIMLITSSLLSTYLGMTIRDYLGWTMFTLSFYYSFLYLQHVKSCYLFLSIISLIIGSFFRLEFILLSLFLPFALLRINNIDTKINFLKTKILFFTVVLLLILILLSFFNERFIEIKNHIFEFNKLNIYEFFYKIFQAFYQTIFKFIKVQTIISISIVFYFLANIKKFVFNSNYIYLLKVYSFSLLIICVLYYVNEGVLSARYFVPLYLIFIPFFSIIFYDFHINKFISNNLLYLLLITIFLFNFLPNVRYKDNSLITLANEITRLDIHPEKIYVEDKRILYYMGYIDIKNKMKFTFKSFCKSGYKYFIVNLDDFSTIPQSQYKLLIDDNKKYKLIEKTNDC